MVKNIRKFVMAVLILAAALMTTTATISAASDEMQKDKTNKLKLSNDLVKNAKTVNESLAAGKALTYKVDVSKGALFFNLNNSTEFRVEIINSDNKVVKKLDGYEMFGGVTYIAKGSAALEKGSYKIKISPKSKSDSLNVSGKVALINNGSKTISLNEKYITAVTNKKSYKFKFVLEEKSTVLFSNIITSYTPDELFPFVPTYKILDSKGKLVKKYDKENILPTLTLKKGTYTLEVTANETGYLETRIGN